MDNKQQMLCNFPLVWSNRLMWLPSAVNCCTYIRLSNDHLGILAPPATIACTQNSRHVHSDQILLAVIPRACGSKIGKKKERNINRAEIEKNSFLYGFRQTTVAVVVAAPNSSFKSSLLNTIIFDTNNEWT